MKVMASSKHVIATLAISLVAVAATGCNLFAQSGGQPTSSAPTATAVATEAATASTPDVTESSNVVSAKATTRVAIRSLPGPTCPIIGWVDKDQVINLQLRNLTDPEYWYQTDFLGQNQPGWIYHQPLSLLNDDSPLPRVKKYGCADPTPVPGQAVCSQNWKPDTGCMCCGHTLVCSDGTTTNNATDCTKPKNPPPPPPPPPPTTK